MDQHRLMLEYKHTLSEIIMEPPLTKHILCQFRLRIHFDI